MMGRLVVYDGASLWIYTPAANRYYKQSLNDASPGAQAGAQLGAGMGMGIFGGPNPMRGYKNMTATLKEAKVLRGEKLHVNDADVDCRVVSLEYEPIANEGSAALQAPGLPASAIYRAVERFG